MKLWRASWLLLAGCASLLPTPPEPQFSDAVCTYYSSCSSAAFALLFNDYDSCLEDVRSSVLLDGCTPEFADEQACTADLLDAAGSCQPIDELDCGAALCLQADDQCEDALAYLDECDAYQYSGYEFQYGCNDLGKCLADCILSVSCDAFLLYPVTSERLEFLACAANCQESYF